MTSFEVVFFDLDHTLWDYETNSLETLKELFDDYNLSGIADVTFEQFLKKFGKVNDKLWDNYNRGLIDREVIKKKRFEKILKAFDIHKPEMSLSMSEEYIKNCPYKTNLMPFTHETLDYLHKKYPLFLLTNGFNDVQNVKIKNSKIDHYFSGMVTSETSGHRKPSSEIYNYTLSLAKAKAETTVMIGDNLNADIIGAKKANLSTVYYNPRALKHKAETDFEVSCLSELSSIL
ncbi:YjjG family noncanonical pyrimidine nucleotidase [Fulvivirga lutimaris]|uniref:YjjG family noncanonical pyrimidine nucleotidase n=1 Tax=Fulvivirga lutimaris TaxID=1819566 RepID=UPI0012BBE83A|nr:YjjG family noncanonical pyrimidine nucleotidase [Fulvivirga lutimaris]MTI40062.1 noncanonical pyrimidine nucleotidase, YjjG family [Fulvivirga lutimaris]